MTSKELEFWKENIKKDLGQPLAYRVGCFTALMENLKMTQEQAIEIMNILFKIGSGENDSNRKENI